MATLYDDQNDPLDGLIAAMEGIGQGVANHQRGRLQGAQLQRQQMQDAASEKDRQQRLWLASRQLAMHEQQQAAQLAEQQRQVKQQGADSAGLGALLQGQFGGGQMGMQGPMPDGGTVGGNVDPEVRGAFAGLGPMLKDMSPEAVRVAGESMREYALTRQFDRSREDLASELQALAAPMNSNGTPGEQPTDSVQMLGGFADPAEVQKISSRLRAAKTPYQLARVEADIRDMQEKRQKEVLIGEFKANARTELDQMFAEADALNSQRVQAGLPSMSREIFAARSQMMDLFRPGRRVTQDQLFGEIDQIRTRLTRLRLGDTSDGSSSTSRSGKAPEAEKGSRAYYDHIQSNPDAYYDRLVENSKTLFDTGAERQDYVDREMQRFAARQHPGGAAQTPAPSAPEDNSDTAVADHYSKTKEWLKGLRVPFDVAKVVLQAAANGEDVEAALADAQKSHDAESWRTVLKQFEGKPYQPNLKKALGQ